MQSMTANRESLCANPSGHDTHAPRADEGWRKPAPSTAAAVVVWDYDTCLAEATREVQVARDSRALAVLAVGVNVLAQAVSLGGEPSAYIGRRSKGWAVPG